MQPNMALSDFRLFGPLKKHLSATHHDTASNTGCRLILCWHRYIGVTLEQMYGKAWRLCCKLVANYDHVVGKIRVRWFGQREHLENTLRQSTSATFPTCKNSNSDPLVVEVGSPGLVWWVIVMKPFRYSFGSIEVMLRVNKTKLGPSTRCLVYIARHSATYTEPFHRCIDAAAQTPIFTKSLDDPPPPPSAPTDSADIHLLLENSSKNPTARKGTGHRSAEAARPLCCDVTPASILEASATSNLNHRQMDGSNHQAVLAEAGPTTQANEIDSPLYEPHYKRVGQALSTGKTRRSRLSRRRRLDSRTSPSAGGNICRRLNILRLRWLEPHQLVHLARPLRGEVRHPARRSAVIEYSLCFRNVGSVVSLPRLRVLVAPRLRDLALFCRTLVGSRKRQAKGLPTPLQPAS
ncbi:hypothetical protein PR048_006442 [Dryococelus australis]|uniref:Uncharacterized protein n=1 Tax=Dryococelus australis TaxID=614101 RepID=A0ABQ9IC01_9NEOP|nr:hypothetical protein PR048_006442 [Dryococelus australis]